MEDRTSRHQYFKAYYRKKKSKYYVPIQFTKKTVILTFD